MLTTTRKMKTSLMFFTAWMYLCCAFAQSADLTLVSSDPSNNATGVDRAAILTAQFSATVQPSSVRTDTVVLQGPAGVQKATLSVSGSTVSVQPSIPLLPWANYTLNISSIIGSNGEQLAAPIALTFKTRDGAWQARQVIYQLLSVYAVHATARNNKGVRIVTWLRSSQTSDDIMAVRFVPGVSTPELTLVASFSRISADPTYMYPIDRVAELNVVIDDDGNAFVTWVATIANSSDVLHSSPIFHLWASRFVPGSGWNTAQIIDGYVKHSATNAHVVFDHAGNAFAMWQQYDCCGLHSIQSVVVSRYTKTTGWTKPVYLDNSSSFLAGKIDIQVDAVGNAYATWSDLADIHYPTPNLMISRYQIGRGWSTSKIMTTESTYNSTGYQALAVNPRGEAFLMWTDDSGLNFAYADQYGYWSKPILIDSTATVAPSQMVLMNNGQAFTVFVNGIRTYSPTYKSWSATHPLLPYDQQASSDPRIVVDLNGNAMVAWKQMAGADRIYVKRYRANTGWSASEPIDNGYIRAAFGELFVEVSGSVEAAWFQQNNIGTTDVQTDRFE